ncbi:hypothetical protein ACTFIY_003864 [Dictyostelium cf. discoideum]
MPSTINNPPKKAIRRAKESPTAKRAADVPSASDDANTVPKDAEASKAKSKKTIRPIEVDDDMYTTESTDESDVEVREKEPKKSKTNSIETKTIDALKNAATAVIFMNLFTVHCSQNGVDPTLKTLMDNGAASIPYPKKHNVFNKDQIVKLYEDTEWLREEISMPDPKEMDEASFEVESILNHDKVKKMYLVKFKGYPEPEWIKEVDTDCEELVREYWNNVQKKQLNSRRERENATIEAVEPIVSSSLSQEVQSSQPSQPITPRHQNLTNTNRNNQSKKRKSRRERENETIEAVEPIVSSPLSQEVQSSQQSKSRNQNTSSDDELDLSLQITTRSGRKVTPKGL